MYAAGDTVTLGACSTSTYTVPGGKYSLVVKLDYTDGGSDHEIAFFYHEFSSLPACGSLSGQSLAYLAQQTCSGVPAIIANMIDASSATCSVTCP